MRKDHTDITLVLDRTGSMGSLKDEVPGAINGFVEKQKEATGTASYTLVQFDSQDPQEVLHDAVDIQTVPDMKPEDYMPRAMTPLYDAVGMAIVRTGERLAALPEGQRPEQVVFVIFTDGLENASGEYKQATVKAMQKEQEEKYNWQFIFLGQGLDVAEQGAQLFGAERASLVGASGQSVKAAYQVASEKVATYRELKASHALNLSDEDRKRMS